MLLGGLQGKNFSTASLQAGFVVRGRDDSLLMSNMSEKDRDGIEAWRWMFLEPHLELSPLASIIDRLSSQIPLKGRERRNTLTTSRHYPVMGLCQWSGTQDLSLRKGCPSHYHGGSSGDQLIQWCH